MLVVRVQKKRSVLPESESVFPSRRLKNLSLTLKFSAHLNSFSHRIRRHHLFLAVHKGLEMSDCQEIELLFRNPGTVIRAPGNWFL